MYPVFLEQGEQVGIARFWRIACEFRIGSRVVPAAALWLIKRRFEVTGNSSACERYVLHIALLHLLKEACV